MREKKLPQGCKFFLPLTSRIAPFYAGFLRVKGERHMKHAVHRVVHHTVHLIDSVIHRRMKKLEGTRHSFWARLGRDVGWNDPAFSSLARPKGFLGSFQPTLVAKRKAWCCCLQSNGNRAKTRVASEYALRPAGKGLDRQCDCARYGARILGGIRTEWQHVCKLCGRVF